MAGVKGGMFANLGPALARLRDLRGQSQAAVARAAGIGKSQLSKYENGKELPKMDSLERVLAALDMGSLEFFYTLHLMDCEAVRPPRQEERVEDVYTAFERLMGHLLDLHRQIVLTTSPPGPPGEEG